MGSLNIAVTAATGEGPTSLAAFDAALRSAGVANFNLIRLSSVIPPKAVVHPRAETDLPPVHSEWGDKLYAVWAFQSAELLGQEAWAGVSWAQDPIDGRGLFVEHEGGSEAQVRHELAATLTSLCEERGLTHLEQRSVVVGRRCEGQPVGALVIAPFQVRGW